eukprot:gene37625-45209_t
MQVGSLNKTEMQESIDGQVDISGSTNAESHITSTIADIPLRLDFILQRRMTTVAQLDAMYQGQVLQLDPQAERQVEITVNGMRIAMGELVELNGRLGVELQDISLGHYQDEKRRTCYLKFSIVFVMVRNAMGLQQVPSNLVLNAVALMMAAFVMQPIGQQISEYQRENPINFS